MVTKQQLASALVKAKDETRESLQLLWDNVNKGQKKQILKKEEVVEMFDRFGVVYENS